MNEDLINHPVIRVIRVHPRLMLPFSLAFLRVPFALCAPSRADSCTGASRHAT
jgi:hypothetical protein